MLGVGPNMNRRWLIPMSLVAHLGLGIFLFATGVWRIEKLDGGRADLALAVMMPPAAPEGGPAPGEKPKDPVKKPVKKKVEQIVQPEKIDPELAKTPAAPSSTPGNGEGSGAGAGSGSGSASGSSTSGCDDCIGEGELDPVCGNAKVEDGEQCDDGNLRAGDGCSAKCKKEAALVPPTVLAGLRHGDTQVYPPDTVKTLMMREGKDRVTGTIKVCIAADGGISSVSLVGSTKYPEYDARLVSAARGWRYDPYRVNDTPMPVCSTVTFIYNIK